MIKIIYFCHSVNRFCGQRISGTDTCWWLFGLTSTKYQAPRTKDQFSEFFES
jgi:hypothetical protein